jgi:predicted Rossmann fold flavoprotein
MAGGYDLLVVGAGPAGMMAAGRAAELGCEVLLLERGSAAGRKLLLTGGSRCNVTNTAPFPECLTAFGPKGGFLRHALAAFDAADLRRWLDGRGVATAVESTGRVFPREGGAAAVRDALAAYLAEGRVERRFGERVASLLIEGGRLAGVRTSMSDRRAPRVLIATGGMSYPQTGSTGDGYRLAGQAGHEMIAPYPALVGLETIEQWPRQLQGISLPDVGVCLRGRGGRRLARSRGDLIWTHFGISGPAVLDVSGVAAQGVMASQNILAELDLLPDMQQEGVPRALDEAVAQAPRQEVETVLSRWVPRRAAGILTEVAGVDPHLRIGRCPRTSREALGRALKVLTLSIARPRPIAEAMVTGGGVDIARIDGRSMESRLVPGLFFAGEVVAIHGPSGGFNLQMAFSTGRLAGSSAAGTAGP